MNEKTIENINAMMAIEKDLEASAQRIAAWKTAAHENDGAMEDWAREELERILRHALAVVVSGKA